jgi:PAS domain S-box-containing protein
LNRTRQRRYRRARRLLALGTVLTGILLSGLAALALDPDRRISQYAHTAWRVRDGAFAGAPDAITQTIDGYLWIGTISGLVRFDGVRFDPWLPPAGKQLLSPNISALLGARDGSLWIGTDAGLSRWKDGDLINYSDPMGLINDIREDRNGTIWFTRANLDDDKGSLCEVAGTKLRCQGKSEGVPALDDGPLLYDARGNLWIGGSSMLTRWNPDSSSSQTYPIKGLESGGDFRGVQALASAPGGSLLVGMTRPGPTLGLQEFVDGVWKPFVVPGLDGRNLVIDALFLDREKALWIGTSAEGLYRVYDGTVDHFRGADGLTGEAVYGFYEDNEGDVWAVTSGGLDRFRDFQVTSFSTREGLKADGVQTVLAARNGTVWMGNFATLDSLHDGRISSIGRKDGLPGEHPSSLFEDHAGRLWVGVESELSVYEKGEFTRIRRPDGSPVGRPVALAEDKDGDLWVESYGPPKSLLRIRDFKVLDELRPPGMPYAASLSADPGGGIWLGLANGDLARYRNGQLTTYNFDLGQSDSRVRRVEVRPDGTVLGATPSGVIGWRDGKKQILSSRNGLPCDFIYTLISDKTGTLWLYTQCGLVAIASDDLQRWWDHPETTLKVRTFDVFDGAQPAIVFNQPSSSLSPDGRLWFANGTVLQMVDPAHIGGNSVPPPVHIEEVTADRKRYLPIGGLGLPPSTRDLEIDYTALSFVIPQKVHFQYKLEGYDRDWQDAGTRRQAFYSKLSPRNYTFRVKARNNSGVWNEAGASLDFFVAPAYYQTVWFRSLGVFLFLAVLSGLYRLRLRQLEGQRDALRKSEKELRDAIDTIPALVWSALPDGSNTYVNKRFVEYTGSSAELTAGLGWQGLVHPDDLERHAAKWREAVATGKPHESEVRSRRSDGQYRWQLDRGAPLRDEDGNIVKWYGVTADIEDRKRAEETLGALSRDLQESKAKLEEAQRIAHVGYWEWDLTANRVIWSDETYRIYGLRPQEYPIDIAVIRKMIHPEDLEFVFRVAEEALRGGLRTDVEHRIIRPNGELRTVHSQGDVKKDASGRPCQMFGTVQDITDRKRAEEALQRSQFYISEGQRVAHMGSWAFNAAGFEYWSSELFRIHGLDPSGKPPTVEEYLALVHPEDRAFMKQGIANMLADHRAFDFTKRIVRSDGEIRHVRCVGVPVTLGADFQGFLGTGMDVTEQERLTDELRLSEQYLSEGQRLAHMGSWTYNPSGFFEYWSQELFKIYGLDPQKGAPTLEGYLATLHPQDRDFMANTIKRMCAEHCGCDEKKRIVRPDGELRYIRCVGIPVVEGEVLKGFLGTAIDITEQELLTQELERQQAHLTEAQKLTHTGSWAWRLVDRKMVHLSEEWYRIYGFDPAMGAPTREEYLERVHPEDRLKWKGMGERAIVEKADYDQEFRILLPNGMVKWIHTVGHPVLSNSGDLEGFVGSSTDITQLKSAEQEREKLRQLEADLAHTNRVSTLGEMAASLAHEIKQPIAAAMISANSCIEWLAHEPPNLDRARAAAAKIDKYGNRAAEIIDHIRSLYRKSPPRTELIDVDEIVHEIFTLLQGEAVRYSITMRPELAGELPKVRADRVQLQQVFMNLMLNAIEAMRDEGGELTVKSQRQNGQLLFSVSDTGPGLPVENVDEIFSAFFTTKPQGSGMGLAISRTIVESHGGRLWATANDGRGATFHFSLQTETP